VLIYGELSQLVGWGWSQVPLDCGVGAGLFADVLPLDLGIPSYSLYTWSEPLSNSLLSHILHGREATWSSRLAKYFGILCLAAKPSYGCGVHSHCFEVHTWILTPCVGVAPNQPVWLD
jgi:hypothetical protein